MITQTLLADTTFAKVAMGVASDGTTIDIFGGAPATTSTGSQYMNTHWQYRPAVGYSGVASRTSVAPTAINTIPNVGGTTPTVYHSGGKIYLTHYLTITTGRTYNISTDTWSIGGASTVKNPFSNTLCSIYESDTHFSYATAIGGTSYSIVIESKLDGVSTISVGGLILNSATIALVGGSAYYLNAGYATAGKIGKVVAAATTKTSVQPTFITPTNANPLASYMSLTCSTATTFFLWNNTIGSQTLSEYDTVTNTWTTFPPFVTTPSDVVYSSMLHLNGFIYMVSDTTDELWQYDIAQNAWFNLSGAFLSTGILPLRRATLTTDGTDIFIVPAETANKTWFRYIP